jgi:hypothetical protein
MKLSQVFILTVVCIVFAAAKLFQSNEFVDDAKCKIQDIDEANEFINPLLNRLRVIHQYTYSDRNERFLEFSKWIWRANVHFG